MEFLNNEYVPIEFAFGERSQFSLSFPPYLDTKKIGVNIDQIDKLCRLGGISHVRIINGKVDEITKFSSTVVGISRNGEALVGKVGLETSVSTYDVNSRRLDLGSTSHAATWVSTTISINNNEICRRISGEPKWKNGTRSTEAWVTQLDEAVKQGITKTGFKHLTIGLSKFDWSSAVFQYGLMAYFEAVNGPTIESAIGRVFFVSAVLNAYGFFLNKARG